MKDARRPLAAVCALVIGVYAYMAQSSGLEMVRPNAADADYNLLVQGFRAGQLSLKKEVPSTFARLADPYDPAAHLPYQGPPYRMGDLSYYHGRLYLYFGITPALILFWPFVALIGQYLYHWQAVTIFCAIGFLASVGLLHALWRRHVAEVRVWVVAVCAVALGLATGLPELLSRSNVHEVAISCGYMLTMLALAAIWCALHESERRCRWLAAASVAYGLAVGARPSLLFGAIIVLVPVAQAWRERKQIWTSLIAAAVPLMLIGLGLMLYNALRFGSPFDFGQHYQLGAEQLLTRQFFSVHYLWFNFRAFFLEPARWSARFPFVHDIAVPPLPTGYVQFSNPFGVVTNIPLVWLALAAPLAWRSQSGQTASILRWFVIAVALLFGTCALTLGLYSTAAFRYEADFLPALVLLAVVGILGLERVLADRPPVWRSAARWGWGLLLGFSVAFNLLATVVHYVEAHYWLGSELERSGRMPEAIVQYEQALWLMPDYAEAHNNLGVTLEKAGKASEAIAQYEQALRIKPDFADAHNNLGIVLFKLGKVHEAVEEFEQALCINPDMAKAHNNLGNAFTLSAKLQEATGHYEQALRINPDFAEAHYNLGNALAQAGKVDEAIGHYEQALRIKPDYAEAHLNLGIALTQLGRVQEAIAHYEQALRIKADYAEAYYASGLALAQLGRMQEALGHWEQTLRIDPDYSEAQYNMGVALARLGRQPEAITHFEQALRIKPDYIAARDALAKLQARQ